jgi:hypothetical protein
MKTLIGTLLGIVLLGNAAHADLFLVMTPQGSTTVPVGGTVDVVVELSEQATSILTTDGLFTGAVLFDFDALGIAALSSIVVGADFDDFSDVSARELVVEASGASVVRNPITLGTITITGTSPGMTTVSTADPNPSATFVDFLSGEPAALDADVFATPASLTITVIPEPGAFSLLAGIAIATAAAHCSLGMVRSRRD